MDIISYEPWLRILQVLLNRESLKNKWKILNTGLLICREEDLFPFSIQ